MEKANLVFDLAVILVAAGVFTIISKALKQPLILGYVIAGFLVGPKSVLFPGLISSTESIQQWSDIGIIFLLFSLGLEFSFKKLFKVGSSAMVTAGVICMGMFPIGMILASIMGWSAMEGLFLGGLMSMSSTAVIIKTYDDMGLKNEPYVGLIFGSLVVEDLIAVVLMVLLSTIAATKQFAGADMLLALLKMILFLALCFVVGMYVLPPLFRKAKKYLNDEILLVVGIGLCFGMVTVAEAMGFSSALGAFVMGSLLSETIEGERIEKVTTGMKNLFGAIFFVSVGMMVDVSVIGEHWGLILVIAVVAMLGILIFSSAGALLSGQNLDTAVHTGFTMSQLGEFSFIIASVGVGLGVMRDFLYPVIITVSVLTTFATPFMIKASFPASRFLHNRLPQTWIAYLNERAKQHQSPAEENEWQAFLRSYLLRIGVYGMLIGVISELSTKILSPLVTRLFPSWSLAVHNRVCLIITLIVLLPFLYGFAAYAGKRLSASARKLLARNKMNRIPIVVMIVLRVALAAVIVLLVISHYLTLSWLSATILLIVCFILVFIARISFHDISKMESRFMANLNAKEEAERRQQPIASSVMEKLGNYNVGTYTYIVPPEADFVGCKLRELPYRKDHQVNIAKIIRGNKNILIPGGDEAVFPNDHLLIVGSVEQLESFKKSMLSTTARQSADEENPGDVSIEAHLLSEESFLTGRTLREADMREKRCMVIGVFRGGKMITNPPADFRFEENDKVWFVGLKSSIEMYK